MIEAFPVEQDGHLKKPPYSIEAEQHVLGSILINNKSFDDVEFLSPSDFYRSDHREIFKTIKHMIEAGKEVDIFLAEEAVSNDVNMSASYLGQLAKACPTSVNAKQYAEVVRRKSIDRQLLKVSMEIGSLAYDQTQDTNKLDYALDLINNLSSESIEKTKPIKLENYLGEALDKIQKAWENKGIISGLSTGLIDLDNKTLGLQEPDLIVIAGRPSMGKTTLAMNIAETCAKTKNPVAFFSMEMGGEQIALRTLANFSNINLHVLRNGKLTDQDWPKLTSAVNVTHDLPLIIDQTGGLSVGEVRLRAKQIKREHGLSLLIIDYLQLMRGDGNNREAEISSISRGLKAIAKELQIPVIALSQLNRELEKRPNKRPKMSDLRDSGAIEQDADIIMFVYRDEVYNKNSPDKGVAEIILGKQRQGELGTIYTSFVGHHCRFENNVGYQSQVTNDTQQKSFNG